MAKCYQCDGTGQVSDCCGLTRRTCSECDGTGNYKDPETSKFRARIAELERVIDGQVRNDTCAHCGRVFMDRDEARAHVGVCKSNPLVAKVAEVEQELAGLWSISQSGGEELTALRERAERAEEALQGVHDSNKDLCFCADTKGRGMGQCVWCDARDCLASRQPAERGEGVGDG